MWLVGQLWWAMFLSAGTGAVVTVLLSTRRVVVERWVDAPVEKRPAAAAVEAVEAVDARPSAEFQDDLDSPFPTLAGARPWEEEELWSRPTRVAVGASRRAATTDEWSEAADNWRDWAGVATGKVAVPGDERAARTWDSPVEDNAFSAPPVEAFAPALDESPFRFSGPVDAPVRHDEPVDPFRYAQPVDPFPYAQPVDAPGAVADDRDDDREAEEIRIALELRRREREEAERLERERLKAERAEMERLDGERLESELREAQRREAERLEAELREAQRLAAERVERQLAEAERLERERVERLEAQRLEAKRAEAERAEAERLEQERVARLESQLLEAAQPQDEDDTWRNGPYGPGSRYAPYDGSAPVGYSVKGHMATKTFHTRRSRLYARAQADVWFDSEESAEAAGFVRWDRRGTSLGTVVAPDDQ